MVPLTVVAGAAVTSLRAAGGGVVVEADSVEQPNRATTPVAARNRGRRIAGAPPQGFEAHGSCASDARIANGVRRTGAHVGVVHRSLQAPGTRSLDPADDAPRPGCLAAPRPGARPG